MKEFTSTVLFEDGNYSMIEDKERDIVTAYVLKHKTSKAVVGFFTVKRGGSINMSAGIPTSLNSPTFAIAHLWDNRVKLSLNISPVVCDHNHIGL
jgi:hypothetical protein